MVVPVSNYSASLSLEMKSAIYDCLVLLVVSGEVLNDGEWCLFAVYKIILGTLENEASADVEWQHARYLRTAKKRKFLSAE